MRTGNELERLTVAEPALLGRTEYLVDASEREQILERILATDRSPAAGRGRISRSRRTAFVLVGVALAAAAVAVGLSRSRQPAGERVTRTAAVPAERRDDPARRLPLPDAGRLQALRDAACACRSLRTPATRFAAAASADGGCVEAFVPDRSERTCRPTRRPQRLSTSARYQGYYVPQDAAGAKRAVRRAAQGSGKLPEHRVPRADRAKG